MNLKLLKIFFKQSIKKFFIYRGTSTFVIIFSILFSILEIITTLVYFSYTKHIGGFNLYEFLILISSFNLIGTIYNIFCITSHEGLADKIINGELDYDLLKPVDSQLMNNFNEFEISSIISALIPLVVFLYSIKKLNNISILNCVLFFVFIFLGAYFYYLLNQLFVSLCFWIDKPSKLLGIPEELFQCSSKPMRVYPALFQIIFAWIIPILSSTNIPVEILTNRLKLSSAIFYLCVILIFTFIVRIQWIKGVKKYTSSN